MPELQSAHNPQIILLTGVPGSGKSTIGDAVAQSLPRCAHIQTDFFRKLVKGGYAAPKDWNEETEKQYKLARKNACAVARNLVEAGFSVIIDDTIWQKSLIEEYHALLSGKATTLVFLDTDLAVAQERNRTRTIWNLPEALIAQSYALFSNEGIKDVADLVIDNSSQTSEQSAGELRKRLNLHE